MVVRLLGIPGGYDGIINLVIFLALSLHFNVVEMENIGGERNYEMIWCVQNLRQSSIIIHYQKNNENLCNSQNKNDISEPFYRIQNILPRVPTSPREW